MITYTERLPYTGSPEYDKHFWMAMRGNNGSYAELSKTVTSKPALMPCRTVPTTVHGRS